MKKILMLCSFLGLSAAFFACEENKGTKYNDVKHIITTSCATPGCHDNGTAQSNVNMSSYATMSGGNGHKNVLHKNINGFYDRVIVKKDMPTIGTLSQADLDLLQKWVDNGYYE